MFIVKENVSPNFQPSNLCISPSCSLFPMQRLYSLSKESGKNAAKYIIKNFPQYFDKTFAEPNVPVSFLLFVFVVFVLCQ